MRYSGIIKKTLTAVSSLRAVGCSHKHNQSMERIMASRFSENYDRTNVNEEGNGTYATEPLTIVQQFSMPLY